MAGSIAQWWFSCESNDGRFGEGPALLLARAQLALDSFDVDRAGQLLARLPATLEAPWHSVRELIATRLELRRGGMVDLDALEDRCEALASRLLDSDSATAARALHTLGVIRIRARKHLEAEAALYVALSMIDDSPSRDWILDSLGQALMWQSAWREARRTFVRVAALKAARNDVVGQAITLGNLVQLEFNLGNSAGAVEFARRTLKLPELPLLTRIRIRSYLVQGLLELVHLKEAEVEAEQLEAELHELGDSKHYLAGFCALILARVHTRNAGRWLGLAAETLKEPQDKALLEYWRRRIAGGDPSASTAMRTSTNWLGDMEKLFHHAGVPLEAEVLTRLHVAEQLAKTDVKRCIEQLDLALQVAMELNNPLMVARVDRAYREAAPDEFQKRILERFLGDSSDKDFAPRKENITSIFCDLVSFTDRFNSLPPEEILDTVGSVYELAVPLFSRFSVQPLQHHGDGLVAMCSGPNHEQRALDFSRSLVARIERVNLVRTRGFGEEWGMRIRAGVASGDVLVGLLGTQHKLEYLCIGASVNLAARLQATGNPGCVVVSGETAAATGLKEGKTEVNLKGFTKKQSRHEITADPMKPLG
ncbi:MAG: adenylate/guanylate cyclase domain-containing protein [Planctomycetes bacterium]|nr:adenylate/guanylate cyclase domain-containing protein [Planctomycetota bacterium]